MGWAPLTRCWSDFGIVRQQRRDGNVTGVRKQRRGPLAGRGGWLFQWGAIRSGRPLAPDGLDQFSTCPCARHRTAQRGGGRSSIGRLRLPGVLLGGEMQGPRKTICGLSLRAAEIGFDGCDHRLQFGRVAWRQAEDPEGRGVAQAFP